MRDPQAMSGNQTYPPPQPACANPDCGHSYMAHRIGDGKRTSCTVHGHRAKCGCRAYQESEANDE